MPLIQLRRTAVSRLANQSIQSTEGPIELIATIQILIIIDNRFNQFNIDQYLYGGSPTELIELLQYCQRLID